MTTHTGFIGAHRSTILALGEMVLKTGVPVKAATTRLAGQGRCLVTGTGFDEVWTPCLLTALTMILVVSTLVCPLVVVPFVTMRTHVRGTEKGRQGFDYAVVIVFVQQDQLFGLRRTIRHYGELTLCVHHQELIVVQTRRFGKGFQFLVATGPERYLGLAVKIDRRL